jgi:alkanesulfonate monooxygenase SsuD/methylene tetrahydromethanopterin reductase-like flavin-dependent oxidoreductase (luciferase family)
MTAVSDPRQPTGTGFALRDPLPWDEYTASVREGEAAGYRALFLPEIAGRDALVALGALAGETDALLLGTGILPIASRSTLLTAMGAATVHERSGGRMLLGIGTGDIGAGALGRLREEVQALRSLLDGGTVERKGRQVALSLLPGSPIPIWISCLGPRSMQLAGEIADGVLLNWCPPERVTFARDRISEGAEAAGRDPAQIRVGVYLRACVDEDPDRSLGVIREAAARYASYPAYARQFEAVGLGEEARKAAATLPSADPSGVPEHLVREVCLVGSKHEARARLEAYRSAGADLPVVYPVPAGAAGPSIRATLTALAPGSAATRT